MRFRGVDAMSSAGRDSAIGSRCLCRTRLRGWNSDFGPPRRVRTAGTRSLLVFLSPILLTLMIRWLAPSSAIAIVALVASGCGSPEPLAFEPNLVHTMKYEVAQDVPMQQASEDAYWIVDRMFGTPEEPQLPAVLAEDEDYADIVSMQNLHRASGPIDAEGRGLYAKHCAKCHAVTGSGRGEIAAIQTPYPRDYRPGMFKFKTTPRGVKPTKADLAKLLRHGIGGTAMNPIPELTDEDIDALVDYVIYLSMRGEVERQTVDGAMFDGIIEDGGRILNTSLRQRIESDEAYVESMDALADADELTDQQEEQLEAYEMNLENWEYAEDYVVDVADSWLEADEDVLEVPPPPTTLPLAENADDVRRFRGGPEAVAFNESVHRGRELYLGKLASCSKCHGDQGLGNGQVTDYDDWTKDWTSRVNLDPKKRDQLVPLLARGALEPKNIIPRNFTQGIFRGGKASEELYRRIVQGVDGTPMPAATFVDSQFEEEDVWHLINFIRTLEVTGEEEAATVGEGV